MFKLIVEIKDVLSVYLVINVFFFLIYYILKVNCLICEYFFDDCFFELVRKYNFLIVDVLRFD